MMKATNKNLRQIVLALVASRLALLACGCAPVTEQARPEPVHPVMAAPATQHQVITLPDQVIVSKLSPVRKATPKVSASRAKVWACGPMHDNLVGGRNRDCEWK